MRDDAVLRIAIPDTDALARLQEAQLPFGLRAGDPQQTFHRDIYYDTPDRTLRERSVSCRLRVPSQGERTLIVRIGGGQKEENGGISGNVFQATFSDDVTDIFHENYEPARVLRAIIDPKRLGPRVELETECIARVARHRWLFRPLFKFCYDTVVARNDELTGTFHELTIRRLGRGGPQIERIAEAIRAKGGYSLVLGDRLARARALLDALEMEDLERIVRSVQEVAVIPFDLDRIGLHFEDGVLKVLFGRGEGENGGRQVIREWFGSSQAQLRLLGTAPATDSRPAMEVWLARRLPAGRESGKALEWLFLDDAISLVGSPAIRDTRTLAALHVAARSDLMRERPVWAVRQSIPETVSMDLSDTYNIAELRSSVVSDPVLSDTALDVSRPSPEQFINRDLSQLAFSERVLELAEDQRLPLLERVKFLSIFSATMDEVFMVRIGVIKRAIVAGKQKVSIDGLTAAKRLDAVSIRARRLVERAHACFREALEPELGREGICIHNWEETDEEQRLFLTHYFEEQVFPVLTPLAASPSHPFPHIANFTTAIAVMVRHPDTGVEHFAAVPLPDSIPRYIRLPGVRHFISVVDVVVANVQELFPGLDVLLAHWFRVTRSGEVRVDEWSSQDLLQAIEEEVEKRPFGPVVRLEVDDKMPLAMQELLVQEFRFENPEQVSTLGEADVYYVGGIHELGGLGEVAKLDIPEFRYEPFLAAEPIDNTKPIFDSISEQDILLHFPYDSFESTVERFFVQAADDPDVLAIKVSLYRTNEDSQIVDALARAVRNGKQVVALVELKARFEEERNIEWAKELEAAGIHVVHGLLGLKTHGKTALVVRREGDSMGRYAYLGTGNMNAVTARGYTDLGLFTKDPDLSADVNDLFNAVSGYSAQTEYRKLLVAPVTMFERFKELIDRETEHAKAGRGGRIRAKMNGLGDPEISAALYRASQAGVYIDLIVRGICTLRPQVKGLSDRIRVVSVLGRFLEHSRIFHFGNAGNDEYYIGSADWRTRNLRRRVEVVAPVVEPHCQHQLDGLLEMQLNDPVAWELKADESYARRNLQGTGSQDALVAGL